jgi:hypothetical protein
MRFLPQSISHHILNNPKMDYDRVSISNIQQMFPHMTYDMAYCIRQASLRQQKRDMIKRDLQKYFNNINDDH